jgi:hypothetical protein
MRSEQDVLNLIFSALENINAELGNKLVVNEDTKLFGADAELDSLALVSVVVDVETAVSDAAGKYISLTDDRAISEPVSPFTTPRAMTAYIRKLLSE